MIDPLAVRLAIRNRILGLVVCTTGSLALSAVATGFRRSSGSFITDGFAPGMEVTAAGFVNAANNGLALVTGVTATDLTIDGGRLAEASGGGRSILVKLPDARSWENRPVEPNGGHPYVEEEFLTVTPPSLRGVAVGGVIESLTLYLLRWYAVAGVGMGALDKSVKAFLLLFPAGYAFQTADGVVTRVRGDIMPSRGGVLQARPGFVVCTLTVPLRSYSQNPVAA